MLAFFLPSEELDNLGSISRVFTFVSSERYKHVREIWKFSRELWFIRSSRKWNWVYNVKK